MLRAQRSPSCAPRRSRAQKKDTLRSGRAASDLDWTALRDGVAARGPDITFFSLPFFSFFLLHPFLLLSFCFTVNCDNSGNFSSALIVILLNFK